MHGIKLKYTFVCLCTKLTSHHINNSKTIKPKPNNKPKHTERHHRGNVLLHVHVYVTQISSQCQQRNFKRHDQNENVQERILLKTCFPFG